MTTELFILRIAYLLNLYRQSGGKSVAYRVGQQKIHSLLEQTCQQLEHYYYRYILRPSLVLGERSGSLLVE